MTCNFVAIIENVFPKKICSSSFFENLYDFISILFQRVLFASMLISVVNLQSLCCGKFKVDFLLMDIRAMIDLLKTW